MPDINLVNKETYLEVSKALIDNIACAHNNFALLKHHAKLASLKDWCAELLCDEDGYCDVEGGEIPDGRLKILKFVLFLSFCNENVKAMNN